MRTAAWLLLLMTLGADAAFGKDFRDSDGYLELPDCAAARAWMEQAKGRTESGDESDILGAALHCAKAGDISAARRLIELADSVPAQPGADNSRADVARVRVLLALGEHEEAGKQLGATSRKVLDGLREGAADQATQFGAYPLQSLNDDLAVHFRAAQPAMAIEHQLYAADAHELAGEFGLIEMAVLYHRVALEIALEARLADACLAISRRLFALHTRHPEQDMKGAARTVALALSLLIDVGREADALALGKELKATGWPEVDRYAGPFIQHLERAQ